MASKPTAVKAAAAPSTVDANCSFPASKAQIYNAARPVYRSHPHRSRRSCYCFCYCCLWIIFTILLLIIISALACGVLSETEEDFAIEDRNGCKCEGEDWKSYE
ncbi:hypothetical protein L1887_19850 [Cichorium endivia]|nr:hypothetical protein L1887_19850 [Cichorium endivia]